MDFSSITRRSRTLGKILKLPLHLIPKEANLPIMQGILRGKRWIVGASVHACWLGSYEMQKLPVVASYLRQGQVFYDVGANVGMYTLLASQFIGSAGQVYAFEPLPRNITYLNRHIALNQVQNTVIYEIAIGSQNGTASFQETASPANGHLTTTGNIQVQIRTLDSLVEDDRLRLPDIIKIDVEGGEYEVLQGAQRLLQNHHPVIFLGTHGAKVHQQCIDLLTQHGYQLESLPSTDGGGELIATQRR